VELRKERPEATPAAGEDAGPAGIGGGAELDEDVDENVVGQSAEAVLAAAVRELRSLGCITVLHGVRGGGIRRVSHTQIAHLCGELNAGVRVWSEDLCILELGHGDGNGGGDGLFYKLDDPLRRAKAKLVEN
jgi:hypothetical protein